MSNFTTDKYIRQKFFYLGYNYKPEEINNDYRVTKLPEKGYFQSTITEIPKFADNMMDFYFYFRSLCHSYVAKDPLPPSSTLNKITNLINKQKNKSCLTKEEFNNIFTLKNITNISSETCMVAFRNMIKNLEKLPEKKLNKILNLNDKNNYRVINLGYEYTKKHYDSVNSFSSYYRVLTEIDKNYLANHQAPLPNQKPLLEMIVNEQNKVLDEYNNAIMSSRSRAFYPLALSFFKLVNKHNETKLEIKDNIEYQDDPKFTNITKITDPLLPTTAITVVEKPTK